MAEPSAIDLMVATIARDPNFRKEIEIHLTGRSIDIKKFMAAAIASVTRNAERLSQCDRQSVYNAVADAAARGLLPDGRQGVIAPFRTKVKRGDKWDWQVRAQFMVMPEGIIELATRSGIHVYAVSVYSRDQVKLWNDGDGMHVQHDYDPFGDRGERVGAMAVGRARDGTVYIEAMSQDELQRVMAVSKQKDEQGNPTGPWKDWPERMEQKSALHRLFRRMPGFTLQDDEEWQTGRFEIAREPIPAAPKQETTSATNGRPKALQKLVDKETGEIFNAMPAGKPEAVPRVDAAATSQATAKEPAGKAPEADPF